MKNSLCLYAKLVVFLFFQTYMYGMEKNQTDIQRTKLQVVSLVNTVEEQKLVAFDTNLNIAQQSKIPQRITYSSIITNQQNIKDAFNENDIKQISAGTNLSATTIQALPYATYLMDMKRGVGHNVLHELTTGKFVNNPIANAERVTAAFQYFIDHKSPECLVELIKMLKANLFEIPILASTKAVTYLEECKLGCKDEFNISLQKNIVKDKVDIKTEHELIKLFLVTHVPVLQAKFNAMEQEIAKNMFETITKINQYNEGVTNLKAMNSVNVPALYDKETLLEEIAKALVVEETYNSLKRMRDSLEKVNFTFNTLLSDAKFDH